MKFVYCSVCGQHIPVIRKAMPKFGTIIDLIEPHECLEEPVEFDLTPIDNKIIDVNKEKNKFVQNLNKLQPSKAFSTNELKDRRFEESEEVKEEKKVTSSAPDTVLDMIKQMETSSNVDKTIENESGD